MQKKATSVASCSAYSQYSVKPLEFYPIILSHEFFATTVIVFCFIPIWCANLSTNEHKSSFIRPVLFAI